MWTDLLVDSRGIERIYSGRPPELESVRLHEVGLDREGPALRLRFDLPDFPADPPKKWTALSHDTIQIELLLGGLHGVALEGFGNDPVADIFLWRDGLIKVEVTSAATQIRASGDSLSVSKVSAYSEERRGNGLSR
ncbi:Imm50 family immunity protein [Streptomyces sp. UNOC14_S4]|uniref:Imm50 family immunity protein n=1 Tax=Streptomyces sp. UNOC14_S4 TaxID=2872340 RepID=UPI001E35C461|nr:Imm50 family immunity protein [Streptomyces sp. UNOC14_S4]MCC3769522.1 immunity 50 family protein [Streptomyces sp. UNOC14_S4]